MTSYRRQKTMEKLSMFLVTRKFFGYSRESKKSLIKAMKDSGRKIKYLYPVLHENLRDPRVFFLPIIIGKENKNCGQPLISENITNS